MTTEMRDGLAQLARASEFIDPNQTYRVQTPDGNVLEWSGKELIRTAESMIAFEAAIESGDKTRILEAYLGVFAE